jgi:dolichyl-phosphate beta-glucosyltransferase
MISPKPSPRSRVVTLETAPVPVALSVVLPCYKAAALAAQSVARLAHAFSGRVASFEIIVVDDGIGDCESALSGAFVKGGTVRVVTLPENCGKGAAVAAGMLAANGAVRVFTDIDIPYGTTPIMLCESLVRTRGFHVVIGDRTFPQSRYHGVQSFRRRAASKIFSRLTGTLVTGGFFDTQCGLKAFRGDIADSLFSLQKIRRFAFDVELLYLALSYGLEIKRIPVCLESNDTTSVRLGRDALKTFADLARIKAHQWKGSYADARLSGLVSRECSDTSNPLRTPTIERGPLELHA